MSLKPTERNACVGIALSAETWARHAIGSDKQRGPEGFENFRSGDWHHYVHYQHIRNIRPDLSLFCAMDEMTWYRQKLVDDIERTARELDEQIMRLQRMEEQMAEVEKWKEDAK